MNETIMGRRVIVSPHLTKRVPRSWRERLFSWPWQPWRATKAVPSDEVLLMDGMLVMHPATYVMLKAGENTCR